MQWLAASTALTALLGITSAQAADVFFNFDAGQPAGVEIGGNNDQMFVPTGGNPATGGFLALTYPVGSQDGSIVFENTDPGKVVTGFSFSCDLRTGNSSTDRAADGFSISFARDGDPFLTSLAPGDMAIPGALEGGTRTGIAVSFDTWSGNTFPNDPNDTADIEGIIVRVDDVTVQKVELPTRHGTADDATSLQTGPRDAAYWADAGDPYDPASWATLAWRPFTIDLTSEGRLTVTWKGANILSDYQTTYFPSAGQLVFAGRTGGANAHTHVDNLRLVTIAQEVTDVPGAPGNLRIAQIGSRRASIAWDPATVVGDPNARVAYEVERNGVVVAPLLTTTTYEDRGLAPNTSYTYRVRGKNIAGLAGPDASVTGSTVADVPGVGFSKIELWFDIPGTSVEAGLFDPHYADPPDSVRYGNGFSFGETSGFGNTFGDNFFAKMTGVLTIPEAGDYRFFLRSDDASALYINTAGPALPDPLATFPIAEEFGCCGGFEEVVDGVSPDETSEVITFTAGQRVGVTFVVKEGGGGDWGQVAIRREGDPTPAGQLTPIRGAIIESPVDAVGASVAITDDPDDVTTSANESATFTAAATGASPYGGDYGNAISWQWYINNVAQLGANAATFTIPVVSAAQNDAKVKVVAAVAGASATSAEATLVVNADTTPPSVRRLSGADTFDSVTVVFTEPVVDPSAVTASNYQITGLTVNSATRVNDRTIRLGTSRQTPGTIYAVTINGVLDNANLASAFTGEFQAFEAQAGVVVFNLWLNETGGFDTFPEDRPPDEVRLLSSAYTGSGLYDNYFGQLKMLFTPEVTGDYVFFIATDDHGELYLSTDADPANKKRIAEEPSWSDPRLWNGNGVDANTATRGDAPFRTNRSDEYQDTEWASGPGGAIRLTQGTSYYLELLYKEGGGGDHGAIAVKLASEADPANGQGELGGSRVSWYIDPNVVAPIITQRPSGANVAPGAAFTLTVGAESALPMTYQWYQNKRPIAGATSASYAVASATVGHIGDYYVVVSNENGSVSTFPDDDVRVTLTGAFVIEAEDYNYDGGKTLPEASVMPLVAELFVGKDGLQGIDLENVNQSTADAGGNGNSYRNGYIDGDGNIVDFVDINEDVIIDNLGGLNQVRPDFTLSNNYKIGWGATGDWHNYTRTFEAGSYSAVFVGSRDGRDANAMGRTLELVTGDITQPDQTTVVLAELTADGTGAWSSNDFIPFRAVGSQDVAVFDLGGTQTLRLRINSGDGDNDAILLYRQTGVVAPPVITGIVVNADGTVTISWTGGGQLEASSTLGGTYAPVPGATGGSYIWTPGPTDNEIFARVRN